MCNSESLPLFYIMTIDFNRHRTINFANFTGNLARHSRFQDSDSKVFCYRANRYRKFRLVLCDNLPLMWSN